MKHTLNTLLALSASSSILLAQVENVEKVETLKAELISTTISNKLPDGLDFMDKPFNHKEGASITFFLQSEDLVSFDKKSFNTKGWKLGFQSRIADSGRTASIQIYNESFSGSFADLKVAGTIDIISGTELQKKNLTLKLGNKPIQIPGFTVELVLKDNKGKKGLFGGGSGVKIVGDFDSIKSLTAKNGKNRNQGSSSFNSEKTYYIKDIKDGEEIVIEYWQNLSKKTVSFAK